ncbi:hypothetical protein F2P79_007614 [Pimephales promelas]|nr:hypothetical protein F2P79_007614 [Pimephales promelas]
MFFALDVTAANPSVLIITSTATQTIQVVLQNNPAVKIVVTNGTSIKFFGSEPPEVVPSADGDSELLKWATDTYGGVTSFTTARHPSNVVFTGIPGTLFQRPSTCDLQPETPADKHFIKLDLHEPSDELQSCYMKHPGKQLHVINIPDDVKIRHVSVHLSSESKLLLRGPPNTEWKIHMDHGIQSWSNNPIIVNNRTVTRRENMTLSDDAGDIRQKVMKYFDGMSITSYSEIRLNVSHIQLWIRDNSSSSGPSEGPLTTPAPTSKSVAPFEMQLFSSPDFRSPLDSNSKVLSDKRVYAEISHPIMEGIPFSIEVIRCWVQSTPVVRKISLKEESCFNDCPNKLRFSFEMLQDLPSSSWDLECTVRLCFAPHKVC